MLTKIFEPFVEESPVSVIAGAVTERILNPAQLDSWFDGIAEAQYSRDLLFSSVFDIMSQVVCGTRKSVHAAYQAARDRIGVSITSVYNKLNGLELNTSAELVRYAAREATKIIDELRVTPAPILPGCRVKLLDGNCMAKTAHRIEELRTLSSGPLPGKALVVFDPQLGIPIDVFPCADGHAQERSLLGAVLPTVDKDDVWIADRNFCTRDFLFGIALRNAFFVIREHAKLPWEPTGKEIYKGRIENGKVYEMPISVTDESGNVEHFRRIRVHLEKPTRDGDYDICIITSLPYTKANAKKIAELYRGRWTIETAFQHLAQHLNSEINTLGYPKAALFGFCIALVAYVALALLKAALSSVHGVTTIAQQVSGYYLADEISGTYRGMMIAIPSKYWSIFRRCSLSKFAAILTYLAEKVKLSAFKKHPRGPKKPAPKRKSDKKKPHVSTARLIAARKG